MRKPAPVSAAARSAPVPVGSREQRGVELICLALALALLALGARIASIW